ncbi:hypothetical protein CMV_028624 [Castanea mollissima]|uniref:Uncharacterized protein n=1 Tax=Castanea mollissima TaxID=60419 RepID=A0A8J4Q725_9ROSI|nr:hypothetical protein CMV_028624 [Castanea mollissima]
MEPRIDDEPQILHPGPLDESLLTRQRYHRSEDIWNGEDPGPLTCHGRTKEMANIKMGDIRVGAGAKLKEFPFRSAFKNVNFNRSWTLNVETPLGVIQNKLDEEESPRPIQNLLPKYRRRHNRLIEVGLMQVYVIGSHINLGKWKVQDGLKLSYAGDSIWQGDCVLRKVDLPIKYPSCKYGKAGNFSLDTGPNRELIVGSSKNQPRYIFLSDGMFRELPWRAAGVAIPMFSVRTAFTNQRYICAWDVVGLIPLQVFWKCCSHERGQRLKVPEIVPFRLTQTIEAALGLTGVEGTFRSSCEAVVDVLRKNKDILLMLLEVFVRDPLEEWTRGDYHNDAAIGGEERKGMELAVSLSLFASRVQEIRVPIQVCII